MNDTHIAIVSELRTELQMRGDFSLSNAINTDPTAKPLNQNASVAGVVYDLWRGEITSADLRNRDTIRMEALGIWQDGALTAKAGEIIAAAVTRGECLAAAKRQELEEHNAAKAMQAATAEAEILNVALDMMKNKKPPAG